MKFVSEKKLETEIPTTFASNLEVNFNFIYVFTCFNFQQSNPCSMVL